MAKQAISVTLDADNLTWLKGRAGAAGVRSVSEFLDQIVSAARAAGQTGPPQPPLGQPSHRRRQVKTDHLAAGRCQG